MSRTLTDADRISLVVRPAIATLIGMIACSLLVGVYVHDRTVASGPGRTKIIQIIGGFWMTSEAKAIRRKPAPPPSPIDRERILGDADIDQIWPRISRALAKLSFQLAYSCLTVGRTWRLACAARPVSVVSRPAWASPLQPVDFARSPEASHTEK